jgi:SpoIID/LytB domain protein
MKWIAAALVLALGVQNANERRTRKAEPATRDAVGVTLRIGFAKAGGGYTVAAIPMDAYIARVLAGEAVRDSQPAALEALAIAVRTFALANRGRHRADDFDLCDQTHCQVVRAAVAATARAAQATSGRVLMRNGAPAQVFFSASCGGRTEIPSAVWPGAEDPPYLPSRDDDACGGAPAWTAEIHERDLLRALRASGFRGERLRAVRIAARNGSGRVARLTLEGLRPEQISGQDLRVVVGRTLGWQHIKSTAFELRRHDDAYRFSGRGSGHGVGMCVIGSARLAVRGATAEAILAHYFPGLETVDTRSASDAHLGDTRTTPGAHLGDTRTTPGAHLGDTRTTPGAHLGDTRTTPDAHPGDTRTTPDAHPGGTRSPSGRGRGGSGSTADAGKGSATGSALPVRGGLDPTPVLVSLPDDDEGQRDAIERQTLRARDELARTLGVPPPPTVTLRFHPTADDYERVTGQPWFTSSTVVRRELHLLPLAVLRDRGVLERTIRHALVHVMTDAVLGTRAMWVREGAAIYFAGEPAIPGETPQRPAFKPAPRASCPDDNELLRPVSVGALTNAYARARACFARQIQQGTNWHDVR